jgi:hypothetical protein
LVILLGLREELKDYSARFSFFQKKGIISQPIAAHLHADSPLHKGEVAVMFCRALGIKGGIWLRLFGQSQRYALRELVFEGIMYSGVVNETVSGRELAMIYANAAEYLAGTNRALNRSEK